LQTFYGFSEQLTRNSNVTTIAKFAVDKDANHLRRPLNGGNGVAYGALGKGKGGN
jgi:hypothetical protein